MTSANDITLSRKYNRTACKVLALTVFNNNAVPIFSNIAIIIANFGENFVSPEIYITTHTNNQFENIKSARNTIKLYAY